MLSTCKYQSFNTAKNKACPIFQKLLIFRPSIDALLLVFLLRKKNIIRNLSANNNKEVNLDPGSLEKIMTNPFVIAIGVSARTLVCAVLLCAGIQLFDFRNLSSFFGKRKIFGLFLLILGIRLLISIVSFSTPFDY